MTAEILITNHLAKNFPYLIAAARSHVGSDYSVTIVSSAEQAPNPQAFDMPGLRIVHNPELNTATKKVEWFMDRSRADAVLFQSDDVIASRCIVERFVSTQKEFGHAFLQTPLSNNEEGSRFLGLSPWLKERDKTIEQKSENQVREILHLTAPGNLLVPVEWFAFYCAFIPRQAYDALGGLDPRLENRYNDVDFCLRARRAGVLSVINTSCAAYHYGTKTLKHIVTPEMYAEADRYWEQKVKSGAV